MSCLMGLRASLVAISILARCPFGISNTARTSWLRPSGCREAHAIHDSSAWSRIVCLNDGLLVLSRTCSFLGSHSGTSCQGEMRTCGPDGPVFVHQAVSIEQYEQ